MPTTALQLTGPLSKYPARATFAWYLGLIILGTFLLKQPAARAPEAAPITFLDAAFTATSAACVTGLVVRSTGNDFSQFGQLVILVLFQLGGIGIMTVTTFVTFRIGRRESLRHRAIVAETLGAAGEMDLRWVLRNVILLTLAFEAVGFVLLAIRNSFEDPLPTALWNALFHSVSAYCNAGFSLFDDSLIRYQSDALVTFTIAGLVVTGGIGFPVLLDLRRSWRTGRRGNLRDFWHHLHMHTRIMLIGTAALLTLGMLAFLLLEWDNTLQNKSLGTKLLISLFQSITTRTAGFNSVEIGALTNATLFIFVVLMMIGGGPCSTAGGFKVSTMMVLVLRAWASFRGYSRVNLFRRTIPREVLERAVATALLFTVLATFALTSLLVLEQSQHSHLEQEAMFLDALFEVISALGTVGLSTGMTTELTDAGRIVIIGLMFIGRLGPISVFIVLSRSEREYRIEFPEEEPLIG